MGWRASVVGASGYAGGELLRLLGRHPNLEVAWVSAGSNAGRELREVHPHLVSLADRPLLGADDPRLGEADLVFLALPHGESAAVVDRIGGPDTVVVDLGADFRLADGAAWRDFYGGGHAGTWPYGLPGLPGGPPPPAAPRPRGRGGPPRARARRPPPPSPARAPRRARRPPPPAGGGARRSPVT